ncbi:MAG: hypothetical protein PHN61_06065 [Methanothrix sp.]|nr:hypothetical protein [Methanothrix sp.]
MKSNRPWWWLNRPSADQEVDDLTEDGKGWENWLGNEQFLLTERDDLELPDLDDILDDLNKDREDLRAVIPPLLQSSGLLLSISLGAIYFILNDGSRMGNHYVWIIFFLFLAVGVLAGSIVSGVWALYKKSPAEGIKKKERVEYERKNRRKDQKYARSSIFALIAAIALIVFALVILSWECGNLGVDSGPSQEKGPLVIVMEQYPNGSNYSYALNFTSLNLKTFGQSILPNRSIQLIST